MGGPASGVQAAGKIGDSNQRSAAVLTTSTGEQPLAREHLKHHDPKRPRVGASVYR